LKVNARLGQAMEWLLLMGKVMQTTGGGQYAKGLKAVTRSPVGQGLQGAAMSHHKCHNAGSLQETPG
jgi:hypothetical protein